MTEPETVDALKELCKSLGSGGQIAERAELPELFKLLGHTIESQQRAIESLEERVAKLEQSQPEGI